MYTRPPRPSTVLAPARLCASMLPSGLWGSKGAPQGRLQLPPPCPSGLGRRPQQASATTQLKANARPFVRPSWWPATRQRLAWGLERSPGNRAPRAAAAGRCAGRDGGDSLPEPPERAHYRQLKLPHPIAPRDRAISRVNKRNNGDGSQRPWAASRPPGAAVASTTARAGHPTPSPPGREPRFRVSHGLTAAR